MGVKVGVGAVWVLVVVVVGVVTSAPPTPDVSKRSAEDIQFGNQQNLPIGLLDDNALPGAFPSSETSEEAVEEKEAMKKEETEPKNEEKVKEEEKKEEDESKEKGTQVKEEEEEEEERRRRRNGGGGVGGGGVMDESRWHNSAVPSLRYYRPREYFDWGVPRLYSPSSLPLHRRRRSPRLPPPLRPHRQQNRHRSLAGLRTLMRARGEAGEEDDQRRQKRDADLDQLLKEVDVMELLNLLTHQRQQAPAPLPPRHLYRPGTGFGTVRYAPAPPRFAPQPKLFPDYEEGEGGEGGPVGGMGLLKQNVMAAKHLPEAIMVPAGGGGRRVWRRSGGGGGGGYGLSALPGFKRSAFRSNNPQPPQLQHLNPNDVYSLAAMLGAELDPVTHRLRRAAM